MKIIFNKGKPSEEVYTEQQIKAMSRAEIKNLKARCTVVMSEIATKRSKYKNENEEDMNSTAFWSRMNRYKEAISIYQRYILYLNTIEVEKEPERSQEQKDNEHWLWCYYQESLIMLNPETVDMLKSHADERCGFHIEFEKIQQGGIK